MKKIKQKIKAKAKPKAKAKVKVKAKKLVSNKKKVLRSPVRVKPKAKVQPKVKVKAVKPTKAKATLPKVKKAQPVAKVTRDQTIFGPVNIKPYQQKNNEEYMNQEQLSHFRNVLLQWKSQLMVEVDRTVHHMQGEVANYPDPVDRASQEEEFSLELRARDRERKLLKKIDETLARINDHDYGYCDDCGAEIGVRRLEARPTATQCIECKTVAEIKEKQIGEGG